MEEKRLSFLCDYACGAHPAVLRALTETNGERGGVYGLDSHSEAARALIRAACEAPEAEIHFLAGGTQTNAVFTGAALAPYQGVLAADCGHVGEHEAGAIERGGHKVLTLPNENGKLAAAALEAYLAAFYADENRDHMVFPGLVYLSHPSEFGTCYSLAELTAIRNVCDAYGLLLYLDGARLAYALARAHNDVTLPDLARLCDAFYIGGNKCGALFGEALVVLRPGRVPHLFTTVKQHGALLAKGRVLGVQFEALFKDGLYLRLGRPAVEAGDALRALFREKGYEMPMVNDTNQVFVLLENTRYETLRRRVDFGFWERRDGAHTVARFTADWGVRPEDVAALAALL